jgi:hypothetical protein
MMNKALVVEKEIKKLKKQIQAKEAELRTICPHKKWLSYMGGCVICDRCGQIESNHKKDHVIDGDGCPFFGNISSPF